jgi:hypothetical protein
VRIVLGLVGVELGVFWCRAGLRRCLVGVGLGDMVWPENDAGLEAGWASCGVLWESEGIRVCCGGTGVFMPRCVESNCVA